MCTVLVFYLTYYQTKHRRHGFLSPYVLINSVIRLCLRNSNSQISAIGVTDEYLVLSINFASIIIIIKLKYIIIKIYIIYLFTGISLSFYC